jgi:hypothetical protein
MLALESKAVAHRTGRASLVAVGIGGMVMAILCLGWFLFGLDSGPVTGGASASSETRAVDTRTSGATREARAETHARSAVQGVSDGKDRSASPAAVAPASKTDRASDPSPALEKDLARVAATFLSKDPDVTGLRAIALSCAQKAVVDEESLRTDASGIRRGKFSIPGTELQGTFKIEGDNYSIDLVVRPPAEAGAGFMAGDLMIGASDSPGATGGAGLTMQFHPDTVDIKCLDGVEGERVVGWGIHQEAKGTVQYPITVRRPPEGAGLMIGHAQAMGPVHVEGDWDVRANDAWLEKLRGFKPASTR